jgi:arylsulfatase A-like enzyme
MRPGSVAAMIAAASIAASFGCAPDTPPRPASPNVVLIVLDTVRADSVGLQWNGRAVTPQLDLITAEGRRFANAYATAPWTLPSHASLFTGLASSQHGAVHEHFVLAKQHPTLAELLARRGYATQGITSNPWVTAGRGLTRGFSDFKKAYGGAPGTAADIDIDTDTDTDTKVEDKGAARASQLAVEFIARASRNNEPFFLFVNYLEAHLPYAPPGAGFAALGIDVDSLLRHEFSIEQAEEIITGERPASEAELELARILYLCEIAYQDQQLGRVLDALRTGKLLDETLVIITADHGELLGREGMMGHEFSLSDDVLRVPLVLRYPGRIQAGQRLTVPVSHLDVLPTVLDLLGETEIPPRLTGKSLLLPRKLSPDRPLIAEYSEPKTLLGQYWAGRHPDFDTQGFAVSLRSLRIGPRKLVENSRGDVTLAGPEQLVQEEPNGGHATRETVLIEMREELTARIAQFRGVEARPDVRNKESGPPGP